jgi:hypothetical protein
MTELDRWFEKNPFPTKLDRVGPRPMALTSRDLAEMAERAAAKRAAASAAKSRPCAVYLWRLSRSNSDIRM